MSLSFKEIQTLWSQIFNNKTLISCLYIDSETQKMHHFRQEVLINSYLISTAKNGLGSEKDSFKTPTGFHRIDTKIGENQPKNMMFKARKPTGECALINDPSSQKLDTITSRILWLTGLQEGVNLSGNVDTKQRYIYIHGTGDEAHLGQAVSQGCIRMNNAEIIQLFDLVDEQTIVFIA